MNLTIHEKIKTLPQLANISNKLKKEKIKIVLCHGVFDLIHPGHIRYFQSAKKHGEVLVVTVTADKYVKKGPDRPVFNEDLRAEVLSAIGIIDYIAIVNSDSAIAAIEAIKPDFYIKGSDYRNRKPNPKIVRKLEDEEKKVNNYGGKLIFTEDIVFSSSHLINSYLDLYSRKTKDYLDEFRLRFGEEGIINDLGKIADKKILVIGDAIIDEYHYSWPMGKSSKEPIVVHKYLEEEKFAGGALATVNHIAAFTNNLTLVTILGEGHSFEPFISRHLRSRVNAKFFYHAGSTIVKRRYIDQFTNQKLFQISYIDDNEITGKLERSVINFLSRELPRHDAVVVNDYGHGFLTKKIINVICKKSKYLAVNAQANSFNYGFHVITKYPKVNFVCIDEMELRLATHDRWGKLTDLMKNVYHRINCDLMLVTRGSKGSLSFSRKNGFFEVPALTQKIVDRVGAGDALFSVAAPCAYLGLPQELVTFLGNVAAALKIQTVGNKNPIDFKEMAKFITRLLK